jgi:hypothetical integral membrane protein (TIGR02206 family)
VNAPPPGWQVFDPQVFVSYGWLHGLTVAICALLIAAPTLAGRALRKDGERALRSMLCAAAVGYWLAYNFWIWRIWHGFDLRTGLPLHICDVNGLIAPLALLTGWRWARATLYFWTATLTVQAFIQPALIAGPASPVFWAFWAAHTIIAACALYDIVVRGFRPTWPDLGRALAVSAAYLALVVPVNLRLGADYGYVGNPAADILVPPFVLMLGPWPQRAIVLIALAALGFAVALLPWRLAAREAEREPARGGAG